MMTEPDKMEEKRTMKISVAAATCAACLCAASSSATLSPPTRVIPNPESSLYWRTYLAGSGGIGWEWPAGAAAARLTVSGKGGATVHVFNRPAATFVPVIPDEVCDEDVLDLALEFFPTADASGDAIAGESLTASGIGVVRGANGAALDFRSATAAGRNWTRVWAKTAVLPVPEGTSALSLDGEPIIPAAVPGWHLWNPIPAGRDCVWTATDAAASHTAVLFRANAGFKLFVR